jgi:predicted ATPase
MRLLLLHIKGQFKNLKNLRLDFSDKKGITLLIGNNGSGKSNILEAFSSVFAGLYDSKYNPDFEYEIKYVLNNQEISIGFDKKNYALSVNGSAEVIAKRFLPSQVVCSYSGEESRLWNDYYEPFYKDYIDALIKGQFPVSQMVYINKYYWNIAVLTFFLYDLDTFTELGDFCRNVLGISSINKIEFHFDNTTLIKWRDNPVTHLVRELNPKRQSSVQLTIQELKDIVEYLGLGVGGERTFFRYIAAAFLPKGDKLITRIDIKINDGLPSTALSEGEKKLVLIQAVLEIVSDENSLILLDEPDSHVHISRKASFQKLLASYANRENVITTHSPTLTHSFDKEHIVMLTKDVDNNAVVESREKQDVIHLLTDGIWSYQEQNIFLNSRSDILLVEGKSDETYLRKALEVLSISNAAYANLSFEFLPCGGADGVKLMTKKFTPKPGQHIIALFDRDSAGWSAINKIFERDKTNAYNSSNFGDYRKKGSIWIALYPIRPSYRGGAVFNIEDYLSKKLLNRYMLRAFRGLDSIVTKDNVKKSLEADCVTFPDSEFKNFKHVFNMILRIKDL